MTMVEEIFQFKRSEGSEAQLENVYVVGFNYPLIFQPSEKPYLSYIPSSRPKTFENFSPNFLVIEKSPFFSHFGPLKQNGSKREIIHKYLILYKKHFMTDIMSGFNYNYIRWSGIKNPKNSKIVT